MHVLREERLDIPVPLKPHKANKNILITRTVTNCVVNVILQCTSVATANSETVTRTIKCNME